MTHSTGESGGSTGDHSGSQHGRHSTQDGNNNQSNAQETHSTSNPLTEETRSTPIPDKFSGNVVVSTNEGDGPIKRP
jgi:hypothetical protein